MRHTTLDQYMQELLTDPEEAIGYLETSLEESEKDANYGAFLIALRRVIEAQGGMSKLAKEASLNRRNLYDALGKDGHPKLETVGAVLHTLGLRLALKPINQ